LLPEFPYWSCLKYLLDSRSGENAGNYIGIRGAKVGIPGTLGSYLLAALLQVRILVAPTIVILLLGRAVLDLMVCVTAIKAKVIGSLISSNFLFRSISIRGKFLGLVGL
jgi:hypothetical protein